jgi:hypothetical protein
MKMFIRLLFILPFIFSTQLYSQAEWKYTQQLHFPEADIDVVRPYLCALADDGKLYVISSRITDINAHNSIFVLNPGDTLFQKFIDFNENGDSDTLLGNIGALRGIDVLNNDVYLSATQPYPKTKPNTVSAMYIYVNADTNQVQKYGFSIAGSGYGSYNHGIAITKDSIIFAGISFGTSFRAYNFSYGWDSVGYASYIPPAQYIVEPGGLERGGLDLIRDVAVIPGADYYNDTVAFYTSRNTHPDPPQSGGIAKWVGGNQHLPIGYIPARVEDQDNFLFFSTPYPYGITVDNDGMLWVAGIDTTRRWVKSFYVDGIYAFPADDLPSQFSGDVQNSEGAPMSSPADVEISSDGNTAFVIDHWGRTAYKFEKVLVGVNDKENLPIDFSLNQNYPNPFNPSTSIRFFLPKASKVRLVVTDVLGREITTLLNREMNSGRHDVVFNASSLASGIYFYTLISESGKLTKKMLLNK